MQIIEIQQANQPLLVVDRWHEQGVFHGFGDRQVDVAVDLAQWEGAYPADLMLTLRQHHSKTIIHLQPSSANPNWHSVREQPPAGDAWIVDYREAGMSGVTVGIRSADCFPVLVRSSAIPVVAAVHCGWRGAESGIFLDTLVLLGRMGAPPKSLEVAIGPGAQSCCYEVDKMWRNS